MDIIVVMIGIFFGGNDLPKVEILGIYKDPQTCIQRLQEVSRTAPRTYMFTCKVIKPPTVV